MKLQWPPAARAELLAIAAYVRQDNPRAATRLVARVRTRGEKLRLLPHTGGRVPEVDDETVREVIIAPYRVVYRVGDDHVRILAVFHSARRFPSLEDRD